MDRRLSVDQILGIVRDRGLRLVWKDWRLVLEGADGKDMSKLIRVLQAREDEILRAVDDGAQLYQFTHCGAEWWAREQDTHCLCGETVHSEIRQTVPVGKMLVVEQEKFHETETRV